MLSISGYCLASSKPTIDTNLWPRFTQVVLSSGTTLIFEPTHLYPDGCLKAPSMHVNSVDFLYCNVMNSCIIKQFQVISDLIFRIKCIHRAKHVRQYQCE